MATNFRDGKGKWLAGIPSTEVLKKRLQALMTEAAQLRILLRTASEIEAAQNTPQDDVSIEEGADHE